MFINFFYFCQTEKNETMKIIQHIIAWFRFKKIKTKIENINWKYSLEKKSDITLFELFSEKTRINIDPQIDAGNLLFDRNYDIESLKKAKLELITSIEDAFQRRYKTDPKKIKRENIAAQITLRISLSIMLIFLFFLKSKLSTFSKSSLTLHSTTFILILSVANLLPLFWLGKSNKKALENVKKEIEKKKNLIEKINTQLKF